MKRALWILAALTGALVPTLSSAQGAPNEAATVAAPDAGPDVGALLKRIDELESRLGEVESAESRLASAARHTSVRAFTLPEDVHVRLGAYTDIGLYKAAGDGVAYVRDEGHRLHPELANYPWVFTGDPWANPVNSQGESADLGLDRTNIPRADPIHSRGKLSFIVNTVNVGLSASAGEHLFSEVSLNFEPRQGTLGSPGDWFDLDLAYLEFKPFESRDLHIFVGKFDSTFGIEYRNRKAPDRFGVTPSLIARYTTGTPTGIKVRGSLADGLFIYNVGITNGGMLTELFAHFHNELDTNNFKTLSTRLALHREYAFGTFELGASGAYGAQDGQTDESRRAWQIGADLKAAMGDFTLKAEFVRVYQPGGGTDDAPFLSASGFYVEGNYQVATWFGLLARADYRKARLYASPNFYLTNDGRATVGARFDLTFNLIAKVEYVRVQELDGPEIDDDVFTSSLIFKF